MRRAHCFVSSKYLVDHARFLCRDLEEYLKSNEDDTGNVSRIIKFLRSESFEKAVCGINLDQPFDSYMKELASWRPNELICKPSTHSIFGRIAVGGEILAGAESDKLLPFKRVFPMKGPKIILGDGEEFDNTFTEFSPFPVDSSPRYLNMLRVLVQHDPRAQKLIDEGVLSEENASLFDEVLLHVEETRRIFIVDIIKAMFQELVPNPVQASTAYSIYAYYVIPTGKHVTGHRFFTRFLHALNERKGDFGDFDAMKVFLEGK